jgi:large subunit ribosomal protein L6
VNIEGSRVSVRGPKGELTRQFPPGIEFHQEGSQLIVSRPSDAPRHRALHGLSRTLLANMVTGVQEGYSKTLELHGTGYRVAAQGDKLVLSVGFSHTVEVSPPDGVAFEVEGTSRIHVHSTDKEKVGQAAANLRAVRPPEPYKGKGIRYAGERVRRKAGKAGKATH